FQINAGIRPHGGASRSLSRKNSLRLLFKEEYGPTKLDYPLFGDGVDRFDTIVVRPTFNDGWGWSGAGGDPLFARDEWHRQTQAAMGSTASRGINVHLYINGLYWGLYNPIERADSSFAAQHFGGDKTEWDSINHHGTVDGSSATWNTMKSMAAAVNSASGTAAKWAAYQALQGNDPNGNNDPQRENFLDVENYIDYLLVSFYSGNNDWPSNNWYAARRRGPESEGFQFFAWDSEISMTLSGRTNIFDNRTGQIGGVTVAYGSLRFYDEFQLAFADRVHKHMFNGGALYVDPDNPEWDPDHPERNLPAARMVKITDEVRDAVVAESARWGDMHRSTPYTRNAEWQRELNELLVDTPGNSSDGFFTVRWGIALNHLRGANLYPDTQAPEFEVDGVRQHGGKIMPGDRLSFENSNTGGAGTVYYTLDGSDPRLPGGNISGTATPLAAGSSIPLTESVRVKARILRGGEWSALTEATFLGDSPTLTISEIHYNPADPTEGASTDGDEFEFIEIYNDGVERAELDGVRLVNGVDFDFSGGDVTSLDPGEFVLVVRNESAFESRYGLGLPIAGEYLASGDNLDNKGEKIELADAFDQTIVEFSFKDGWYGVTDGRGFSLTRRDPGDAAANLGEAAADLGELAAWRPSSVLHGTPGADDSFLVDAYTVPAPGAVVINEVLAHSDELLGDWIELFNASDAPINIGGWFLSDDDNETGRDDPLKYEIPANTIIAAGGFATFTELQHFGALFALNELGDDVVLQAVRGGALIGYRAREDFDANENGVTLGRIIKSTGGKDFVAMEHATFGAANADPLVGPVVIHEIMVDPGDGGSEFVELINIAAAPVDLAGWTFNAIAFTFGPGAVIQPGELIVVVPNRAAFLAAHDGLDANIVFGPFTGRLNNAGESLRLLKPGPPEPIGGFIPAILVDRVSYDDKAPWPVTEPGVALQRIVPEAYGNEPQNWGVSVSGGTPGDFFTLPTVEEVLVGSGGGRSFSIPAGADQLQTIAWTGIDRISIRFSEHVVVSSGDLQIAGVNLSQYPIVDFQYDQPTTTATWTLGRSVRAERLLVELSADVHDGSNLPLDGNWIDAVSSFPSGNGVIDSSDAFQFRINVVPGDVTGDERVDRADLIDLIHSLGQQTASAESLRRDLTGDGRIDVDDLRAALLRLGSGLPTAEPSAFGSATPQAAVDVVFERLGGAGAAARASSHEDDDQPVRRETPAFRRRLGESRSRAVSEGDDLSPIRPRRRRLS
ncbi:MAG: lamin tail domain-containing protein, partial [Planctomycetes bacterium]|nr:lamin tail domain-containing protein [Planctomycetota bacterium]